MGRMENVDENFQFFRWCQEFLVLVVKSDADKETRTKFFLERGNVRVIG